MAVLRLDGGLNPATEGSAFNHEGIPLDGQAAYNVTVQLSGAPSQIATDYATLITNVAALTTGKTITWNKA